MTSPDSADLASASDLAAFVTLAWEAHADHPRAVAAALVERAATLRPDADSAGAIVLAEHVWLAHLADSEGLERFLASLPTTTPAAAETQAALQRARWALATLSGRAVPSPPEGARWRALHSVWSVWAARGRAQDALAMLRAEAPAALSHPDAAARRGLAATCNNLAADLREGPRGDAACDALMLAAASASRDLWASAGTWVNAERADYQLARCHATAGDAARALAHAQACLATIDAHAGEPEADAFERFYAHEALAWAHREGGDAASASAQRARMVALMAEVPADLHSWCEAALRDLDAVG